MSQDKVDKNLKHAKTASRIGLYGALGVIALAACVPYLITGGLNKAVLLAACLPAIFHYAGCIMFSRYFKSLAAEAAGSQEPK